MERLTLEDAITHAKEVSEKNYRGADFESIDSIDDDIKTNCIKCAEEHDQIAEWLEDYKHIKQWKSDIMDEFCKYDVSSFEELVTNARNKAIDDFIKNLYKIGEYRDFDWEDMYKLAEQLKAGVTND